MNNQLTAAVHVRDGGGTIDSSEVTEMLRGLFSMAGVRTKLQRFRLYSRVFTNKTLTKRIFKSTHTYNIGDAFEDSILYISRLRLTRRLSWTVPSPSWRLWTLTGTGRSPRSGLLCCS